MSYADGFGTVLLLANPPEAMRFGCASVVTLMEWLPGKATALLPASATTTPEFEFEMLSLFSLPTLPSSVAAA